MGDTLRELSLDDFLARLSSDAPTPGGGSASALAGATGAALLHMVLALAVRPSDGPADEPMVELRGAAAGLQSELLELVEHDAAAYDGVVRARRLPRGTAREAEARRAGVSVATREATRVPLEIARRASDVLDLAGRVASIGNPNTISDVGVAALLAAAAVRGAALNVRINLPSLAPDDPLGDEAATEVSLLLGGIEARERAVIATVEEALG